MIKKMLMSTFLMAIVGSCVVLTLLLISETAPDQEKLDERLDGLEKEISDIISEDKNGLSVEN